MNFTDTKAYILLQEGHPAEAVKLLEEPGIVDTNSDGDLLFRYAFALHALALEKEGDEKERLEQKAQAYLDNHLRSATTCLATNSIFYVATSQMSSGPNWPTV